MLGKFFECEADKNIKFYRVIQTVKEYSDGRRFPINEVVVADKKINFNAEEQVEMGGFCVSTFDYIFRWLIRGDTLCKVIIPENEKIYKTVSENGIYIAEKIILTNPKKIDDNFATELYLNSNLPAVSYFKVMTACAICGYIKTALRVCEDKVNEENVDIAIFELDSFCDRRNNENNFEDTRAIENVKVLKKRLLEIKDGRNKINGYR
jgi:hypothetical protein